MTKLNKSSLITKEKNQYYFPKNIYVWVISEFILSYSIPEIFNFAERTFTGIVITKFLSKM